MPTTAETVADLAAEQLAGQLHSREALDTKAGVLIGVAAIVVGLLVQTPAATQAVARQAAAALAAAAGLAALVAFWPRRFQTVDAEAFAALARAGAAVDVSLLLARQRSAAVVGNERLLSQKVWVLRTAAALLVLAAVSAAVAVIAPG